MNKYKKNHSNTVAKKVKKLFPLEYSKNQLPIYLNSFFRILQKKTTNDPSRIMGSNDKPAYQRLIKKYSNFSKKFRSPKQISSELVADLFSGLPRWRSSKLQYNLGAPTNTAAVALYSMALDENIYNINSGLAGNALVAEQAVSNILSKFAGIKTQAQCLFTFGGTGTNLYALKLGTKKAAPHSGRTGMPKNIKVLITKDAHFSHTIGADWLGIGTDNVLAIEPDSDRRSNLQDAEHKMNAILSSKDILAVIIINGGTTYDHCIDDIYAFRNLRDKMVKKYRLKYTPHLHIDSVIGWAWLTFYNYDFRNNPLNIPHETLLSIREQYKRISQIKLADSWSVDFHKSLGSCPVPTSAIIFNNIKDLKCLSKVEGIHQLAPEFSFLSPADFTLETSRPGGAALAALTSLHTLGEEGYQWYLGNLVHNSIITKELLSASQEVMICNPEPLGYVTMFRLYPPELRNSQYKNQELVDQSRGMAKFVDYVNDYTQSFFEWDKSTRMNKAGEFEYSFSKHYLETPCKKRLSSAKLYYVSPHITKKTAQVTANKILTQKQYFDKNIWQPKNFR